MKKVILSLALASLAISSISAQQEAKEKAWEHFLSNDLRAAFSEFSRAASSDPSDHESIFMLSLISGEQNNPTAAMQHFARFLEVAPDINPYLAANWFEPGVGNGLRTKKDRERERFLVSLLRNPDLNSTNQAVLNEMLGEHYHYSDNLRRALEHFSQIGSVNLWQIVGPFYNEAGSGFATGYRPIEAAGPEEVFTNSSGAPVSWYNMINIQPGRWLHLPNYFFSVNSVVYAQTFCHSQEDREVVFRLGVSGSVRVWVNDKEVFRESTERNNGIDAYKFTARLNQGANRILLQLGSSRVTSLNYFLRITDLEGNIAKDLSFRRLYQTYIKDETSWKSEVITCPSEEYFSKKIESDTENPLNYILLAKTYLIKDNTFEAKKIINQTLKRWPESMYLLSQLLEAHGRDGNITEQGLVRNRMKEIDPNNPQVLVNLFDEAFENEDYVESQEIINRYERVRGRNETSLRWRIFLASEQKNTVDMFKYIEEAYKKFPKNSQFVLFQHIILNAQRNYSRATRTLRNALRNNFNNELILAYATQLMETGRFNQGLSQLEKLIEHNPNAINFMNRIANINKNARRYREAVAWYNKALAQAPTVGVLHESLGDCFQSMNRTSDMLNSYRKALEADPNNFSLRNKLRLLENQKPVFDHFEKPDFAQLLKDAPEASDFPGESSIILLHEAQKVAYASAGQEERHYYLVKVFNNDGIDVWKEVTLPKFDSQRLIVERADVIKKNGSTAKAEVYDNQVIFTALEAGDAVALIYKVETRSFGRQASNFSDEYMFSAGMPTKEARFSLLIEDGLNFDYKLTNTEIEPTVEEFEGFTKHTWERFDLPAIKEEILMSAYMDLAEVIHISTFPNWQFIMDLFNDFSMSQARTHYIVQAKVDELLEGKGELADMEKAKIFYDYVTNEIRYSYSPLRQSGWVPQRASDVISTMIGDCKDVTTLFIALCQEVRIDASPVLIKSRSHGSNLPIPSQNFDHAIARLNIDGEVLYLELTWRHLPFGAMHPDGFRAMALEVKPEGTKTNKPFVLEPPTRKPNTVKRNTEVRLVDNKMEVEVFTERAGFPAASMRDDFQGITHEEQRRLISTSIAASIPNIDLIDLEFDESLDNNQYVMSYRHKYAINNPITRITNLELFKIPLTDALELGFMISEPTRKHSLNLWHTAFADKFVEEMVIHIPEGKVIVEVPDDEVHQNEFIKYKISFKLDGNRLLVTREHEYLNDVVSPEKYPEFRAFLMKLIDSDSRQLAFRNR